MKCQYDIAIIGAGSAGLVVASAAASMGAHVLLVENRKMGGDCLNYGCVPSKAFLKSAHLAQKIKKAHLYGLDAATCKPSITKVMKRVASVIAEIAPHDSVERFQGLGVDVKLGNAFIVDKNTVKVGKELYTTKKLVISTGSTAAIPPIKGLDKVKYLTNETIFSIKKQPKKLIVLGAGPIGSELGQGFAHLGSDVHIVDRNENLFTKDDAEVSDIMKKAFKKDGINLHLGVGIEEVSQSGQTITVKVTANGKKSNITGDALLLSVGRTPNTKGFGLEDLGIELDSRGFIVVNDKLQTNIPTIYACGDVRGKFQFTHSAGYEAGVVVKNALVAPIFKTSYHNISWTTYTVPEVAHVGISAYDGEKTNIVKYQYKLAIDDNDRAKAEDDREGFIKVLLDAKKRLVGATIVGEHAGNMLPQLSLMVSKKMKLSDAMSVIYQYPIQGEIVKMLALQDFKTSAKGWQKALLKKIVRR